MTDVHPPLPPDPALDALTTRVLIALDAAGDSPAVSVLREVVEWALGVEYLRQVGDEHAPTRPVGREVLAIIADGRPGAGWAADAGQGG